MVYLGEGLYWCNNSRLDLIIDYEEIFGKDDEPTCKTLSIDYEAEYHRCVGMVANIQNEREEAKSAIIAQSAIITEQRKKIAELERRLEDEYWQRRDSK